MRAGKALLLLLLAPAVAIGVYFVIGVSALGIPGTQGNHIVKLSTILVNKRPTDAQANLMMYLLMNPDWFEILVGGLLGGAIAGFCVAASPAGTRLRVASFLAVAASISAWLFLWKGAAPVPGTLGVLFGVFGFSWGALCGDWLWRRRGLKKREEGPAQRSA